MTQSPEKHPRNLDMDAPDYGIKESEWGRVCAGGTGALLGAVLVHARLSQLARALREAGRAGSLLLLGTQRRGEMEAM